MLHSLFLKAQKCEGSYEKKTWFWLYRLVANSTIYKLDTTSSFHTTAVTINSTVVLTKTAILRDKKEHQVTQACTLTQRDFYLEMKWPLPPLFFFFLFLLAAIPISEGTVAVIPYIFMLLSIILKNISSHIPKP